MTQKIIEAQLREVAEMRARLIKHIEAQKRSLAEMLSLMEKRDSELREELVQVMAENGYAQPMTEREKRRYERGEREAQEDLRTLR